MRISSVRHDEGGHLLYRKGKLAEEKLFCPEKFFWDVAKYVTYCHMRCGELSQIKRLYISHKHALQCVCGLFIFIHQKFYTCVYEVVQSNKCKKERKFLCVFQRKTYYVQFQRFCY